MPTIGPEDELTNPDDREVERRQCSRKKAKPVQRP